MISAFSFSGIYYCCCVCVHESARLSIHQPKRLSTISYMQYKIMRWTNTKKQHAHIPKPQFSCCVRCLCCAWGMQTCYTHTRNCARRPMRAIVSVGVCVSVWLTRNDMWVWFEGELERRTGRFRHVAVKYMPYYRWIRVCACTVLGSYFLSVAGSTTTGGNVLDSSISREYIFTIRWRIIDILIRSEHAIRSIRTMCHLNPRCQYVLSSL